jgi:hypothetical protein
MVEAHQFIEFDPNVYNSIRGYEDFMVRIKPVRIYEWIMMAREDLGTALWNMGDPNLPPEQKPGLRYIVDFKKFILAKVGAIGTAADTPQLPAAGAVPENTVKILQASCDKCGKTWSVLASKAAEITKCPFCEVPTGGEAPAA